jgi:hypothetical protein
MLKNIFVCIFVFLLINIFSGCQEIDDNEQIIDENDINISCSVRLLGNNILLKNTGYEKIKYDNMNAIIKIGNNSFNISPNDFVLLFGNDDKYWDIGESFAIGNYNLSIKNVIIDFYLIELNTQSVIIYGSNKYGNFIIIEE